MVRCFQQQEVTGPKTAKLQWISMNEIYSLSRHFYQDLSSTCFTEAASHSFYLAGLWRTCPLLPLTVATLGIRILAMQESIKLQTSFMVTSSEAKTMMKAKRGKPCVRNLSGPVAIPFSSAIWYLYHPLPILVAPPCTQAPVHRDVRMRIGGWWNKKAQQRSVRIDVLDDLDRDQRDDITPGFKGPWRWCPSWPKWLWKKIGYPKIQEFVDPNPGGRLPTCTKFMAGRSQLFDSFVGRHKWAGLKTIVSLYWIVSWDVDQSG